MRIYVLGTGSTGNCTVIESEGERLVVDAGMNPTQATAQMRALGADLFTDLRPGRARGARVDERAAGIVVTHHHGDHAAHALPMARALGAPLFMHRGVSAGRARSAVDVRDYTPGTTLRVGPFAVDAMFIPHDAPQVALRVSAHGRSFAIATDLGHIPAGLPGFLGAADVALVEANHCPRMLADGPYPPRLKHRVRSPLGHLANEQTADLARRLVGTRVAKLVLGHLSRANNTPEKALAMVASRCAPHYGVDVLPQGAPRLFEITHAALLANPGSQLPLRFA